METKTKVSLINITEIQALYKDVVFAKTIWSTKPLLDTTLEHVLNSTNA